MRFSRPRSTERPVGYWASTQSTQTQELRQEPGTRNQIQVSRSPGESPRALPSGAGRCGAGHDSRALCIDPADREAAAEFGLNRRASTCQWAALAVPVTELISGHCGSLSLRLCTRLPLAAFTGSLSGGCARDGPALASPLAEGNGVPIAVSGIWQSQDNTTCESYDDRIERRNIGLRAVHHV